MRFFLFELVSGVLAGICNASKPIRFRLQKICHLLDNICHLEWHPKIFNKDQGKYLQLKIFYSLLYGLTNRSRQQIPTFKDLPQL